jgi:hypothetical protein
MNADVIIVTCAEPDALPFLLSLPPAELMRATLVGTRDVIRSAERQAPTTATSVINGLAAVDEVRRLIGSTNRNVAVVVAPDPWGPVKGKGFVRARLLAPWFLASGGRAHLVELTRGGGITCTRNDLTRAALLRRLYVREALLLLEYIVRVGVGRPADRLAGGPLATLLNLPRAVIGAVLAIPVATVTLARLIPFILWTEARARMKARRR